MSFTGLYTLLVGLFKIFPVLKAGWESLIALYIQREIANMREDVRVGIRKAIDEQDQRDLEQAYGNPNAGEPVRVPDAEIVDSLPGVTPTRKP